MTKFPKQATQIALVAPSNRKESLEEKLIDSGNLFILFSSLF